MQLGLLPHLTIVQTSSEEIGQIYVQIVNWLLMTATITLVLGFRSSGALAGAYGVAINTTMVITTVLAYFVAAAGAGIRRRLPGSQAVFSWSTSPSSILGTMPILT